MIQRCTLVTLLVVSVFWSTGASGEGSLRGNGIFDKPQQITIVVELNDLVEDPLSLLEGPILSALNGEFSTLTGNDNDEGEMEVSLQVNNSGERRLGTYSFSGPCRRCPTGRGDRLALTAGYSGALKSAVKQWCNDEGRACKRNAIKSITYELS